MKKSILILMMVALPMVGSAQYLDSLLGNNEPMPRGCSSQMCAGSDGAREYEQRCMHLNRLYPRGNSIFRPYLKMNIGVNFCACWCDHSAIERARRGW